MNILVTGATGFIGQLLCAHLLERSWRVYGTLLASESPTSLIAGVTPIIIDPLGPDTEWRHALANIDVIIHLAARVHIMEETVSNPLIEFRKVNVEGTQRLALDAVRAGVKRLVFISSIKVNGEEAALPYTDRSPEQPVEFYGISKWEAEQALRLIEAESDLEITIIRPTLVYGPGVKANFLNMLRVIQSGFPLPFASIDNKRSMIYVGNLVDALAISSVHPAAAGQTFLVSDGEDVSTPELIRRLANAFALPARLLSVPQFILNLLGKMTGKSAAIVRLTGSLTVDISGIRQRLGWCPPFTMDEGLRATAEWYLNTHRGKQ